MAKYPDWIYRQSAVLPYRRGASGLKVLLITSRKGKRWILPKGIVEPGMTAGTSAAKEALEEAGIKGEIWERSLASYADKKWGGTCAVEVFPMQVSVELADWPEAAIRRREWLTVDEAAARIDKVGLRNVVLGLPKAMTTHDDKGRHYVADTIVPPRVLYLFRHAKSSWDEPGLEDFARPLAPRGERAGEAMRNYMKVADVRPRLVLCSSAVRTRQTLDAVLPAFDRDVDVAYENGLYHGGASDLTKRLRHVPDEVTSIMLVGHNPTLQALAESLVDGGDAEAMARLQDKFPTGALATLVYRQDHWRDVEPGACELHSFVVPRELG